PPDTTPITLTNFYDHLTQHGYHYGPTFQALTAAWKSGDDIYALVELDAEYRDAASDYEIHPALLDAALHALAVGDAAESSPPGAVRLPFGWNDVTLHASGARSLRVRLAPAGQDSVSITAWDEAGSLVLHVGSLVLRTANLSPSAGSSQLAAARSLYQIDWAPLDVTEADQDAGLLAVLDGVHHAALDEVDGDVVSAESLTDLTDGEDARLPDIVIATLGEPAASAGPGHAAESAHLLTTQTLSLVGRWLSEPRLAAVTLVLLSRGAVELPAAGGAPDLAAAAARGRVRAAPAAHPGRIVLVDIDDQPESARILPAAVRAATRSHEPELMIRAGRLYRPRLVRGPSRPALRPPSAEGTAAGATAGSASWRLDVSERGTVENLMLRPNPDAHRALGTGEIRVALRAAGLNFRDVMIALGMYPGEAALGSEGAGVVLEVGPGVQDLAPGDRVMGLLSGGAGPVCVTERALVTHLPRGWSFATAAAVPIVFMTAYRGLVDLAGLRAGESVLVHAAAGGVGTAATQLARHLGAEVFGTASTGKWRALRDAGLDDAHIADSRTLGFEQTILERTAGRGVDVVLNATARDFVDASLRLLPRGGRFLEMGKTDIRAPERVARDHPGVRYQAFDLMEAGPARIQELLVAVVELFEAGVLTPPPITAWDIRRAPEAFRHLGQARHVGKVVLTVPAEPDPTGTVLVTGGTGALGAQVARHLVATGRARHLLLTNRRGDRSGAARELVEELSQLGAQVRVEACDVADRTALAELVAGIPADHPLTAVVHTAGVLDDALLADLTPERVRTVLRPKVDGAWNLHELTAGADLAAFVLFSSVAGTLGNPGQANYAAANAFLDAMAEYRARAGLPATSLAWGPWAGGGMAVDLDGAARVRLDRGGIRTLPVDQALALLDAAMAAPHPVHVPVALDLAALRDRGAAAGSSRVLDGLVGTPSRRRTASAADAPRQLADRVAGLGREEQDRLLVQLVRAQTATVLGNHAAESVPPNRPFTELGVDSLAAVELRNRLATVTGLRLPTTLVFDHPTPVSLADLLRGLLLASAGRRPPPPPPPPPPPRPPPRAPPGAPR
ncbi:SDR family NAD(P)-dependent oxidoreductase, partial [Frankia sp. AgB1.9]|uniref:SDR family NAD(P)-dependent oxidoreductase n=1 Tax=Frankia sp. AgB1.9 TaxID=1836968 RepID=UPI0019328EE9